MLQREMKRGITYIEEVKNVYHNDCNITRLFEYIKSVNELKNNEDLRLILYIITFVQNRIYI